MAWLTLEEEEHVSYPKKVWKGITSTIQSKLRRLRRSRTFIKTTKYVLARLPSSNCCCHHHHHHVHLYYHDYHYDHHRHNHQQGLQTQRRLPNMHVDKLLLGNATVNNQRYLNIQIENEKDKALVERNSVDSVEVIDHDDEEDWQDVNEHLEDDDEEEDENLYALVDTINSKTLILRGVNAKSENFINNFYEGLKLEKQKSI